MSKDLTFVHGKDTISYHQATGKDAHSLSGVIPGTNKLDLFYIYQPEVVAPFVDKITCHGKPELADGQMIRKYLADLPLFVFMSLCNGIAGVSLVSEEEAKN